MKKGHIRLERRICLYFFVKNKAVAGRYQRRAVKEYKRISSCLVRGGICVIVKEIFNVGDFIMPQPFLSVLILTKNNQRSINYALMSVQSYADEIISPLTIEIISYLSLIFCPLDSIINHHLPFLDKQLKYCRFHPQHCSF